jgi:uncharacterized protein (DUF58 family)
VTLKQEDTRSGAKRSSPLPAATRTDSRIANGRESYTTVASVAGLTNARTRIVGDRTGFLADIVVALVRAGRGILALIRGITSRIAAVVTPLGWSTAIVVPLALLFGYRFGWLELVAVGYAGAILLAIAVLYLVARVAFEVELVIPHRHLVVGQPGTGVVSLRNPTRRRVFGTRVEVPVGRALIDLATPSLAAGEQSRHEFTVPTSRRGVLDIGPVRGVRADPVGLVRRELVWTGTTQLFVHPKTIDVPSTSTGLIRDLEGQRTRDLTNSDVSFHALREYVAGDERRYIHWKSTAKTGTYMVRQFEETRRSRLVVALSLAESDFASDAEFEMAVSAAGSLGLRAIRDAREVSVVVGDATPEFAKRKVFGIRQLGSLSRTRLLDDLAGVERAESSLTIVDVARVTAEKLAGISVAFLVCGSLSTPTQLRAASVLFPVGVEVIAVVCDPDAVPGLRRFAGLSVLTIGHLEDLARSLARSASV